MNSLACCMWPSVKRAGEQRRDKQLSSLMRIPELVPLVSAVCGTPGTRLHIPIKVQEGSISETEQWVSLYYSIHLPTCFLGVGSGFRLDSSWSDKGLKIRGDTIRDMWTSAGSMACVWFNSVSSKCNKVSRLGGLELDEGHKWEFMACPLCTGNSCLLTPGWDILLQKRHHHLETQGKVAASHKTTWNSILCMCSSVRWYNVEQRVILLLLIIKSDTPEPRKASWNKILKPSSKWGSTTQHSNKLYITWDK